MPPGQKRQHGWTESLEAVKQNRKTMVGFLQSCNAMFRNAESSVLILAQENL